MYHMQEKNKSNIYQKKNGIPKYLHIELFHGTYDNDTQYDINFDSNNENDLNTTLETIFEVKDVKTSLVCLSWYQRLTTNNGHYFISKRIEDNKWIDINDREIYQTNEKELNARMKKKDTRIEYMIFLTRQS